MAKFVAVAAAVRAGQPPQPVKREAVAGGALGQRRRLLRPHLSRICKSPSQDVAEAVVGVTAAEPLFAALSQPHLDAFEHPTILLFRPRVVALRAPQVAAGGEAHGRHALGCLAIARCQAAGVGYAQSRS